MKCEGYESPLACINPLRNASYCPSVGTSASASSVSGWSDASSQRSDDSSASSSDSDSCESYCQPRQHSNDNTFQHLKLCDSWSQPRVPQLHIDVPAEARRNPRRTSSGSTSRSGCPPALVRQADRKVNFVDNLVDSSTQIVEAIWPTSSVPCRNEAGVLPLRTFIQETLRRSRTSFSTLQVALYYLILIKPHVPDHDFTMEQPDDCHTSRVLQCGRRMFLAALILASKYLQDRNYSARAWSKISGLNTQEINQNEMTFLLAVNWKLHITDDIYNRWTDCVMKHTPSQPPSPGASGQLHFERQCEDFKNIILALTPELDNLDEVLPRSPVRAATFELPAISAPRSLFTTPSTERLNSHQPCGSGESTPTPKSYPTPLVLEPTPVTVHTPGRLAPAFGLLPTPRLTPQTGAFCTPAVSAAPFFLARPPSSMGFAMAQAGSAHCAQALDRWPGSSSSSPLSYALPRRSSLANMSTASSPESMVSDSSRNSRSSSISSASSLANAPLSISTSSKLDVQARCRSAKMLFGERLSLRPTIASVPEDDYEESMGINGHHQPCITSSPESYGVAISSLIGKDMYDMSLETTPLAKREALMSAPPATTMNETMAVDDDACMREADAARALQELHNSYERRVAAVAEARQQGAPAPPALTRTWSGLKRSRPLSTDNTLHEKVRDMLNERGNTAGEGMWSDSLVRSSLRTSQAVAHHHQGGGGKRLCCSSEATAASTPNRFGMSLLHPSMGGVGGPGMWQGILN